MRRWIARLLLGSPGSLLSYEIERIGDGWLITTERPLSVVQYHAIAVAEGLK